MKYKKFSEKQLDKAKNADLMYPPNNPAPCRIEETMVK